MKITYFLLFYFLITISIYTQTFQLQATNSRQNSTIQNTDSSEGKIIILNSTGKILLEIIDEESGGSISLPSLSTIISPSNKLYNLGNMIYWNDQPLLNSSYDNGWNLVNESIFLSEPNYFVGIGTVNPEQRLHIENGSILIRGNTNWFPGLTINNDVGRSVLNLRGTTSDSNYSSSQIIFEDLTNGKIWNILNSSTNTFTVVNHLNGTNYLSPLKIEFGAPNNSLYIKSNGNVGLGVLPNEHRLAVAGSIISEEVIVKLQADWPDYVFDDDYKLSDLDDLENFILKNHHLEGIPSASEINKNGINIADIQIKLLQKIEELTLYIIKQDKNIKNLTSKLEELTKIVSSYK